MTFEMKMQEARDDGKSEGLAEMAATVAKNMLRKNEPIDKITEYTGLTTKQIQELAKEI